MRNILCLLVLLCAPAPALAQIDPLTGEPLPPPGVSTTATYPGTPYPAGMRVQAGQATLVRNTPSLTGLCGNPPVACTAAHSVPPSTFGVIQPDAPVLDPAGWYWQRIAWDNSMTGWSSAYPTYVNPLNPPQMIQGVSFSVVGNYSGPTLTGGICINDGINSPATLQLQPNATGQQGTMLCAWKTPGVGNHKAVIRAVNNVGQADSTEFQFVISTAPIPTPPTAPNSLRIAPATGATTLQSLDDVSTTEGAKPKPTAKPEK